MDSKDFLQMEAEVLLVRRRRLDSRAEYPNTNPGRADGIDARGQFQPATFLESLVQRRPPALLSGHLREARKHGLCPHPRQYHSGDLIESQWRRDSERLPG